MTPREVLELKMAQLPGLARRPSRYGDAFSYFVGNREIAHFHRDGRMDIRLTKERIRELKQEGFLDDRVRTRGASANWAAVRIGQISDVEYAIRLVEEAIRSNQ
jgi:Family of unknown function (DUF5519)